MTNSAKFVFRLKTSQWFEWVHGDYKIEMINGDKYIVPRKVINIKGNLITYKPDFDNIGEVLMSWDFNKEKNVISFVNEYGLFGLVNYWLKREKIRKAAVTDEELAYYELTSFYQKNPDKEWTKKYLERYIRPGVPHLEFLTETSRKWKTAFNLFDMEKEVNLPYAPGKGIVNSNRSDIEFWQTYREPLNLFHAAITKYQEEMKLLISNPEMQVFSFRPSFISLGKGKPGLAIESLLEGVHANATFKMAQGIEFRPCRAVNEPRYECKECEYGKRYFWVEGKGNALTKEFGVPNCKPHKRVNQADKRSGIAKEVPQRGKRKTSTVNSKI